MSLPTNDRVGRLLAGTLQDFRQTWRTLFATDILYKILAFALLTPLAGLALRILVSTSGSPALADTDILFFFLSPFGVVAFVILAALSLSILALEQACLMAIGLGAVEGKRVGLWEALGYGLGRAGPVMYLAMRVAGGVLLLAAPFLAVGGVVYYELLTEFDINYYLSQKPPEFWLAASILGVLLVALAAVLLQVLAGWVLALPILLFEGASARRALPSSKERVAGHRRTVALMLAGWILGVVLTSGVILGTVNLVSRWILTAVSGSVSLLVLTAGGLLALGAVVNLIVSLVAAAAFALLVVRLYELYGSQREAGAPELGRVAIGKAWRFPRRAVPLVLLAFALVGAIVGWLLVDDLPHDQQVLVTAHRGAAGAAPENTLASMERAIADGTDFVELDVQETADGEVVVIHDRDLMKIGGTNLAVHNATYQELQSVDIGSWFAPEFHAERIPTLAQVLELAKGRARVDIELKYYGFDQRLEERVVEIVEAVGMESEIVVMSLKYEGIQKIRELRPDWTIGLLTATALGDLTRVDADFLAVHASLATSTFIRRAHRRGKQVFAWTVNDPVEMWKLINRGVDSLITDEPALARAVIAQREGMNAIERLAVELSFWFGFPSEQLGPETDIS